MKNRMNIDFEITRPGFPGSAWLVRIADDNGLSEEYSAASSKRAAKQHALRMLEICYGIHRERLQWVDQGGFGFRVQINVPHADAMPPL